MTKRCPYFCGEEQNVIVCKGVTEDCDTQQGFANSKDKQLHVRNYCDGFYAKCFVAQILNECRGRYTTMVCPHNSGVDCLDATQCSRCGWNPAIAADRLRKWAKIRGYNG